MLPRDLSPASFRGVRFFVPSDSVEAGRNAIRHAYPDASFHYLEDNGLHPPEFKITAILHGVTLPSQWRALNAALTRPGPGLLKHPWFGNQHVMVDGKFRVQRDDRDAGVLEIEIPFSVTGPPALPGVLTGVAAYVTGLSSSAITTLFQDFARRYGSPLTGESARVLSDAVSSIGTTLDLHFAASGTAGADIVVNAPALSRDGARLGKALEAALRQPIEDDTYSAVDLIRGYSAVRDLAIGMAAEADAIRTTTTDRAIRRDMLAELGATVEAGTFLLLADAVSGRDYATADDVALDEARLAAAIDALQTRTLDAITHQQALDVYTAASEVLQAAAVRLPKLTGMRLTNIPASVLAYHLYESDAQLQTLVDLNLAQNPVLMTGDLTVLMDS